MNFKPLITYSGAGPLFRSLEVQILNAIPLDTCEWRRTHHRPTKRVRLEAQAQPFNVALLEKYKKGNWSILEHPVLHIFIVECNDVDTYKATLKEEIDHWMKALKAFDIVDWMILLVETLDIRKTKNILARTTVLDKIRMDFCTKNDDRCISILNPAKFEQKSTESFRCLIQRVRFLMLDSYNRLISKYEELMRSKREKRYHEGWDFRQYFLMQEDLALVFEKLQLYTEALLQYEELDVMFSQLVTDCGFGDKQKWLQYFNKPLTNFYGICLKRKDRFEIRNKIYEMDGVSLLEFRNYLFERQASMLQQNNEIAEIAKKLPNFLFTTIREIEFMKLDMQEGALACWEFVCALEVLHTCEMAMEPNELTCFQYCAPIWNLAKDKLYELGKLCGLLPGCTPSSEQLHLMLQLSTGVGDSPLEQEDFLLSSATAAKTTSSFVPGTNTLQSNIKRDRSPNRRPKKCATDQLKEALSSNQAFTKLYLELAELAISTYKHVSRHRSARLIGLDLGNFYCSLNEPHKAVGFFTDLLRELKTENWNSLCAQTLLELANCYRKMGDSLAYIKTCSAISCCQDLEILVRTFYFDEFLKSIKTLKSSLSAQPSVENATFCMLEDHFKIMDIQILNNEPIIQDHLIKVQLTLDSYFPRQIIVTKMKLSYEIHATPLLTETFQNVPLTTSQVNTKDQLLDVKAHLDYKQDQTLACACVALESAKVKQPVRRTSSTKRKLSPSVQSDFVNFVEVENVALQPGLNTIELQAKATRVGTWDFKQLLMDIMELQFLSEQLPNKIPSFEITTKPASAILIFNNLIGGIEQKLSLKVSAGSFIFPPDASITLKCSKNLHIRLATETPDQEEKPFESSIKVPLHNFKSFEERLIGLDVLTEVPGKKLPNKQIEHNISLLCPWSRQELQIPITFQPAIEATCHLQTCGTQKFLQVIVKDLACSLWLSDAEVTCDVPGVQITDLNPESQNLITIHKSLNVNYLYEIYLDPEQTEANLDLIKVHFRLKYSTTKSQEKRRNFGCIFDLVDYRTLFKLQAQLEPTELYRLRTVCSLHLTITKIHENPFTDLMYEVLSDQNLWAVCGRSAGVVSMKDCTSQTISLDVMPLSTGFLPLPTIRLSKYTTGGKGKGDTHSKIQPFPPGQLYNSTKSHQVHVVASNTEQ